MKEEFDRNRCLGKGKSHSWSHAVASRPLCLLLVWGVALSGLGSAADFESGNVQKEIGNQRVDFQRRPGRDVERPTEKVRYFTARDPVNSALTPIPPVRVNNGRTSSIFVGSVMALLAALEDAGVLPPEGTAQANQIIHALIQLQSVLVKSDSPELGHYRSQAQDWYTTENKGNISWSLQQQGLTSHLLEALLRYSPTPPLWEREEITRVFQAFNVSRADWDMIDDVFSRAEVVYRNRNTSIHEVFADWRARMPGGG